MQGETSTEFIREKKAPAIRRKLKNYQTLKLPVDQSIDLATELFQPKTGARSDLIRTKTWCSPFSI